MKDFVELFNALDSTTKTSKRVEALVGYFSEAEPADAAWALYLLDQGKPPYRMPTALLKDLVVELTDMPLWLIEESYSVVGDLAETLALVMHGRSSSGTSQSLAETMERLGSLKKVPEEDKRAFVREQWQNIPAAHRFVFNKLLTGGFRAGVARGLLSQALAKVLERPKEEVLAQIMGGFEPSAEFWLALKAGELASDGRPYPFFLASPLETAPENIGQCHEFQFEYKYDGIRGQLVVRDEIALWSRGEDLVNQSFPDIIELAGLLPSGTVLDGEIVVYRDNQVGSFNSLQTRLGRKKPSAKIQAEQPCSLMVYDLIEWQGKDLREHRLDKRRALLETLELPFPIAPTLTVSDWSEAEQLRAGAREKRAEGLMIKRLTSPYRVGRVRGDWFKHKLDPLTLDTVLLYAQAGHGNRANLYSDYTLGVWSGNELVPLAKAYSGLTREELEQVDQWIKRNTLERFGPVRSVPPELVFEVGFEGINQSSRHKSGLALRFPRLLRWRQDKPASEANRLDDAQALFEQLNE